MSKSLVSDELWVIIAPLLPVEPLLPFGGAKQSGNGHRELGRNAVEEFSETKTVFVSYPDVK